MDATSVSRDFRNTAEDGKIYVTLYFKFRMVTFQLLLGENHKLLNREMHIHYNDTVNHENDTVNDTVFLMIMKNNKISASEISTHLKISLSTVKRKIKQLKESGILERIGSDKSGSWSIVEK